MLSDLLDKLTSYNLFNYLLPGAVFAHFSDQFLNTDLIQKDYLVAPFLYYFIGLTISRIGSIIFEPILKLLGVISFHDYARFIEASKKDVKVDTLMEAANMYRTIASLFLSLLICLLAARFLIGLTVPLFGIKVFSVVCLWLLFTSSYVKQIGFVKGRIEKVFQQT